MKTLNFIKKFTLFFLLFSFAYSAQSQLLWSEKQIYKSADIQSVIPNHKVVAILPFDVSIRYKKLPSNFNEEANRDQERAMSKSIQSSLYTYLLRKSARYTVSFQDIEKTNLLLKKANMMDKLDEFNKQEIAQALGVDAVLGGRFETEQSASELGAVASAVLLGSAYQKTGTGGITLTLNNGADGELLWRFYKRMDNTMDNAVDDLVERIMRKVSRNFPYSRR